MATDEKPKKSNSGKSGKRRYFRRRRRKGSGGGKQQSEEKRSQGGQGSRSKSRNRRRSNNRRRSSRRRRSERNEPSVVQTPPQQEDDYQPPTDVYIYTHTTRPAYREGLSGDFYPDHSLKLSGATSSPQPGMDYLLENIGKQLDEWFASEDEPEEASTERHGEAQPPNSAEENSAEDRTKDSEE